MRLAIALFLCAGAASAQDDQRGARFSLGGAGVNLVRDQHWRAGVGLAIAAGFYALRFGAGGSYRIDRNCDAAQSPITRERTQYTAGVLAAYEF